MSWSIRTGELIDKFSWHQKPVNTIKKINNRVLVTAGWEGRVVLWDTVAGIIEKAYQMEGAITEIFYTHPQLVVLRNRNTITSIDLESNQVIDKKKA